VIRAALDRRAERKRLGEYQLTTKAYSDALKQGMTRVEVEGYLRTRGNGFKRVCCFGVRGDAWADLVKIGKEKAPWFCSGHNVYAAFVFDDPQPRAAIANDDDRLKEVTLYPQLEGCL
jgi:hypothetical protein